MNDPLDVVQRALAENGFDDSGMEVKLSDRTSGVVITWIGHGVWSFDPGMMRSSPILVAGVAQTAEGRNLTRILLDLADDEYEPFTNTPVTAAEDAGEDMATEANLESGDPRQG